MILGGSARRRAPAGVPCRRLVEQVFELGPGARVKAARVSQHQVPFGRHPGLVVFECLNLTSTIHSNSRWPLARIIGSRRDIKTWPQARERRHSACVLPLSRLYASRMTGQADPVGAWGRVREACHPVAQ